VVNSHARNSFVLNLVLISGETDEIYRWV